MTTMETTTLQSTTDTTRKYGRRRSPFGRHVAATVDQLQQRYMRREPSAVAVMAQLRAAVAREPGAEYAVLAETSVPERYLDGWQGDAATDNEHAKHAAVTLHALHQQSIYDRPMHIDGVGLGTAVRRLFNDDPKSAEAVRRRFIALGTATNYTETVFHLRSMIRQLREKRFGLDYGLLADDLVALRNASGPVRVRALWGRDFYRAQPAAGTATDPAAATLTNSTPQQSEE